MKRRLLPLTLTVLVLVSGHLCLGASSHQGKTLVLRVSAPDSEHRIRFEGAVVAMAEAKAYRSVRGTTPFEMKVTTTALHALLHSISESEELKVEVFEIGDEGERRVSFVAGRVVVVEQNYGPRGRSMVKGFGHRDGV